MPTREEKLAKLEKLKQLRDLRAKQQTAQPQQEMSPEEKGQLAQSVFGFDPYALTKKAKGIGEAAATIGSSAFAEPVAGLVGLGETFEKGGVEGAKKVEEMKQKLIAEAGPEGQKVLQGLGEGLNTLSQLPGIDKIIEGAKNTNDFVTKVGEVTGESLAGEQGRMIGGSLFSAIPKTAMEIFGFKGLKSIDDTAVQAFKTLPNQANKVKAITQIKDNANRVLQQAAPTAEELKTGAQAIYKQIDEIGISVKPEAVSNFSSRVAGILRKQGFDAQSEPLVARALARINESQGPINTQDIGVLRKVAQKATQSGNRAEARFGRILVNEFDDFLTGIKPGQTTGGDVSGLGNLYKRAGELWRRSIKTETIDDLFENARLTNNSADAERSLISGFKGLISKNRKTKQFNEPEIDAMKRVVKRGKRGSLLNLVGKLDMSPQQKIGFLGTIAVTGGVGAGAFGGAGATLGVTLPTLGLVSRKLAERLTRKNAQFAKGIIAAGNDGNKIVTEYLTRTPKKLRDSAELTELLINRGANVDVLKSKLPIVREAVENTKNFTPAELAVALGLATPEGPLREEGTL